MSPEQLQAIFMMMMCGFLILFAIVCFFTDREFKKVSKRLEDSNRELEELLSKIVLPDPQIYGPPSYFFQEPQ